MTRPGRFFEHQAFGWDDYPPLAAVGDGWSALMSATRNLFGDSVASALPAVAILVVLGLLCCLLVMVDRRLCRAATEGAVPLPFPTIVTPLLVPLLAWGTLSVSQHLMGSTEPTVTLASLLMLLFLSRAVRVPVGFVNLSGGLAETAAARSKLMKHLVVPAVIVLWLASVVVVAQGLGMPKGAIDLFTLVRNVAIMIAVVVLLPVRAELMLLVPQTGNPKYLTVRRTLERLLTVVLGSSLLLLLLWNLGFRRAAETILLRSYAVLAVILVGALATRWLSSGKDEDGEMRHPVLTVIVGPADWVLRLVVYGLLLWALLATLGLWVPLSDVLAQPFLWVGKGGISLLGIMSGVSVFLGGAYLSRTLRAAMETWWFSALEVPAATQQAISASVHYGTMLIAGAGALTLSGIDLRGLAVFAGAAGLGLGLGLREFATQTVNGLTLIFAGTVGRGDAVTLSSGQFGRVQEIGLRRVIIETPDGSEISVPSSDLVSGQITVWTRRSPFVRVRATVTLPVGSDFEQTRACLVEASRGMHSESAKQPMKVWLKSAQPSGLVWESLVWVDIQATTPEEASARLLRSCLDGLNARGLVLARPTLLVSQEP